VIEKDKRTMSPKRILERRFTSKSSKQTLDLAYFWFIWDLVYLPVYVTNPKQKP